MPGPSSRIPRSNRSPSSISYGQRMSFVVASYSGDEQRLDLEDRPDALADELDDRGEVQLLGQRAADLVDQRQLGVALAGLLDGAGAAEGRADVLTDEGEQVPVGFGVHAGSRVYDWTTMTPSVAAVGDQRRAHPVAVADDAEELDLATGHELGVTGLVEQERLADPQDVGGRRRPPRRRRSGPTRPGPGCRYRRCRRSTGS